MVRKPNITPAGFGAFAKRRRPFALPPRRLWTGEALPLAPLLRRAVDHDPQAFEAYCRRSRPGLRNLEG